VPFKCVNWSEPAYLRRNRPELHFTAPAVVDAMLRYVPDGEST
jgi:hypothetical protein